MPTFRGTGIGYSGLSPLDELLYRSFMDSLNAARQMNQQTQQMAQQALDWLSAPRDPGCMQKTAVLGAGAGAVIGGAAGGLGGGAVGGVAGSIVPVAGTAAGLAGGASLGIAGGASLGGAIGYTGGLAIGFTACMSRTGGTGDTTKPGETSAKDNQKADDLIRGRLKASQSYHAEYGSKTYSEIKALAKQGDRSAQQMKKLIEQGDRLMQKLGNK